MITFLKVGIIVYCISSKILLHYPLILHKKKKVYFEAVHISHRGGCAEFTENTVNAFQLSLFNGTHMFETDCHLTKDKHVVLFHDHTLKRCMGMSGSVSDYDYAELPKYSLNIASDVEPGVFHTFTDRFPVAKIEDLFEKFPYVPINIDLKIDDDYMLEEVGRLIQHYKRETITVWGSLNSKVEAKCKRFYPDIPTFGSFKSLLLTGFFYAIGLLPFVPITYDYFESPLISIYRSPDHLKMRNWDKPLTKLLLCFFDYIAALVLLSLHSVIGVDITEADKFKSGIYYDLLSPSLIRHLRLRGIPVYLWVCNSENEFKLAFELGASGVMTDYPKRLTEFLRNNPQYPLKI